MSTGGADRSTRPPAPPRYASNLDQHATKPLISFEKLGFAPEQTYTTLKKRKECRMGIRGRRNVGPKYVCVDGPVFSMAELKELPDEL